MVNCLADKIYDILYSKGKISFERGSSSWSDWDYKLRCAIFNYGSLLIMLSLNILLHSWLEFLIIVTIFNVMRNFTDGIHAKVLSFCTLFSTCYFTILSVMSYRIIYSNNLFLYYTLPCLAIIWSIYNYRYIPKVNINAENELQSDNNDEELTIDEKKRAYKWFNLGFVIVVIVSLFLYLKLLVISISFGLISLNFILSNTGEKVFNFIQDIYLKLMI